jgi:PAS domain S-box-containing protein
MPKRPSPAGLLFEEGQVTVVSHLKQAPLDDRARNLLASALDELKPRWRKALLRRRALWKTGSGRDALIGVDEQVDLGPLEDYLSATDAGTSESEELFLNRVRRQDYSAADLFVELLAAQEALPAAIRDASNNPEEAAAVEDWSEGRIQDLFLRILEETSCVYESMAESGRRGYCQVDNNGRVVFANRGLLALCGDDALRGKSFWGLFGEDGAGIFERIRKPDHDWPQSLQLELLRTDGEALPVLAEFAPISDNRGVSGAYAAITDLSSVRQAFRQAQKSIFEKADFGIIRTNRQREIAYANPAALNMLGVDSVEGWTLEQIPIPRSDRERLLESFERRMEGESDTYEVTVTRKSDKREIPVSIVAIPELNENSRIVGAFAIIRDRELEVASDQLHAAIETADSILGLLEAVAEQIGKLLDFDALSVYILSNDGLCSRPIFSQTLDAQPRQITRWYESNAATKEARESSESLVIEDLEAFLIEKGDHQLLANPDVQNTLENGIRYWYARPIALENVQVAGISLGTSKPENLARAEEVMQALPLAEAIRMVFQLLKAREQEFLIRLLRSLHASKTAEQAASILTREIAAHFEWDNVAIFRVDAGNDLLALVQQAKGPGPQAFSHKTGINRKFHGTPAARAYETDEVYYVNNVSRGEGQAQDGLSEHSQSVLCIPVSVGGATPWVVQVEDCQQTAFVEEDIAALKRILAEVRSLLDDLSEHYRLRHVFENASDAIVTCRNNGDILDVNGPAVALLGSSKGELEGKNLTDLLCTPDVIDSILAAPYAREIVTASDCQDREWKAIITSYRMPDGFDRNVLIIQDLALYERLAELEKIRNMFGELAHQTRAPISLMQGSLRRLSADCGPEEIEEFKRKVGAYLRKIELTYRQILLQKEDPGDLTLEPLLLRVDQMLDRILERLPPGDQRMMNVSVARDLPLISVDVYRTDFIFATIIGNYLRFVPLDEAVELRAKRVGPWMEFTISASLPADTPLHSADTDAKEFAANFTLENPMVRRFIEDLNGEFEPPSPPGDTICTVRLPLVAGVE